MNAKQSKATTSNNKRYSLLIALFCLCVMAYGQMFKVSKPAKKLDHTTTATEWPTGMVWQNLAVDDNGTKRYWRYNALEEAIVLQETKGNTPDEEWAFVEQSPQTYFIYNRAAGPTCVLMSTRLPSTANITEVLSSKYPRIVRFSDLRKAQRSIILATNSTYHLMDAGGNGFYITPLHFNNEFGDYDLPLRLSVKEEAGLFHLHTALATETSNTRIISEEVDRTEERYRDSILARLNTVMPIIKQATTQSTQSKDGVVGSWHPEARTQLKTHYNAYATDLTNVDKAKALLDYYLQAIKEEKYITLKSGHVYRIANTWEEFGSYSLTLDPTTDQFMMAPTDPNDLRQHFIFLKHIDGHYIGSPYTGKFMAMPQFIFTGDNFGMRSLNTHVKFERRAYGTYNRIGSLTPYTNDASIQQIRILSAPGIFSNDIGFLEATRETNLGGFPIRFSNTFMFGSYSPEQWPHAGWYIYPVATSDVQISTEAFTDLVRGANITATAGRVFAPTINAATTAITAYKNAIATFPPTPSSLAKLHTEVTMEKLKAMPWTAPRPNISFRLLNWRSDSTFSPLLMTASDKREFAMNHDLEMTIGYNDVYSYNSFVFVPHESQPNKYKLWQVQRDQYLVINEKGYPGFSENKSTPPVILTLKPYLEDSTQVGFTMQIEDGRYVSVVLESREVMPGHNFKTYFLKYTPEFKNEPTFSSVWSCDTSIIDVAYIDDLGYTTFSSSRAATLPNELTAHKVTAFEQTTNTLAVKPVTESIIPANTGVLLKGTSGPYWLEDTIASGNVAAYADNLLKPNVAPTLLPGPVYMLSGTSPADVGFYRSRTNILFPAKRAYLPQSVIFTGAPALRLVEADIISNISTVHDTNTAKPQVYYDLQGRRVEKPTKGIYIVNGQKVAF